jgi:catechol 2,3-dioxygenase-like lactoylglutathione lyase family enzyme
VINGAHLLLNSKDADADRAFLRDVLGFTHVDAGHGWLIFALPPGEIAVHPADQNSCVLYLMCDDVDVEIAKLKAKNVQCAPLDEARWGRKTTFTLPGGGEVGLYQPSHPTAIGLK